MPFTPENPRIFRPFLVAIALLLSCLVQAQGPRHLVVAAQTNNPPYEYVDAQGKVMGYTVDVMRAVAKKEGLDIEIRSMVWSGIWSAKRSSCSAGASSRNTSPPSGSPSGK